jgi:hypothetical protein
MNQRWRRVLSQVDKSNYRGDFSLIDIGQESSRKSIDSSCCVMMKVFTTILARLCRKRVEIEPRFVAYKVLLIDMLISFQAI